MWPVDAEALVAVQRELAGATPEPWAPSAEPLVGGCWVCFPRGISGPGRAGDQMWTAAVVLSGATLVARHVVRGEAGASYTPGLLALRVGPVMEQAVRGLGSGPDVLLLDASGRDHPRGAGLAVHLGRELELPTVGVTHRPLVAEGEWPPSTRGATSPLTIGSEVVGCWMRTQPGARPLAVHPGWRVDLPTAVGLVEATTRRQRTPEPLRQARRLAREARVAEQGPAPSTRSR